MPKVYETSGASPIEQEAKQTITNLLMLQHSSEFDPALRQSSPELAKIQKKIAKGLKIDLATVEQTTSTYAWDISRAVSLIKWCDWCGFLNESETWKIMNSAASKASHMGHNWTEYTVSFLLGRTMHGFDLDDIVDEAKELLKGEKAALRKTGGVDVYQQYPFKQTAPTAQPATHPQSVAS